MNNCIGLWATRNSGTDECLLELHLNFWKVKRVRKSTWINVWNVIRRRHSIQFLDVGVKCETENLNEIHLYVPFATERANVEDLGICLRSRETVHGLFNEHLEVSLPPQNGKHASVSATDPESAFDVYAIDTKEDAKDIESKSAFGGTIITFHVQNYVRKDGPRVVYFRIRIHGAIDESFTQTYRPRDSFFQTAFSSTDVIDIRINETRKFENSLIQEMEKASKILFRKLHIFVIRDIEDDLVAYSSAPKGRRILEEDLWRDFRLHDFRLKGMAAYHWKNPGATEASVSSFGEFAKFVFKRNNLGTIFTYVVVIGTFSVLCDLLASHIFDLLNPDFCSSFF